MLIIACLGCLFWWMVLAEAWTSISTFQTTGKTRSICRLKNKAQEDCSEIFAGTCCDVSVSRRQWLFQGAAAAAAAAASSFAALTRSQVAEAIEATDPQLFVYRQRFPSLFAPLYGISSKKTLLRQIGPNLWVLEQLLELGPLQTPIRCTVIKLSTGKLWIHAPLAPTEEFFHLVESLGVVGHIVVPSYALEHKIFVKDAVERWPSAELWASSGQFTFPFKVSEEFVFGRRVSGVLEKDHTDSIPWADEIEYQTLAGGTFDLLGNGPTTFYETVFFHKASKSLIVTDCLEYIPYEIPELNDPDKLLLVSKTSTDEPQPDDTPAQRLVGWKKMCLLVSYFFPEHEEPDPEKLGVVTWTPGWQDNFDALGGRLLVPPVVRTLIYAQNPAQVQEWVDTVAQQWDFLQIVPAHFQAPITATPSDFKRAFRFLQDPSIDAFPAPDLARGLQPIADLVISKPKYNKNMI